MSKIVCDICGTGYDDSKGSCPVCGWNGAAALSTDGADLDPAILSSIPDETPAAPAAPAPKKAAPAAPKRPTPKVVPPTPTPSSEEDDEDDEEEESGSNTFLIVILVILILALLAVSAYIGWTKILKPRQTGDKGGKPQETISAQVEETTDPADVIVATVQTVETEAASNGDAILCTGLEPVGSMQTLTFKGQYWRLMVKAEPENTTEKITYTSSDEKVVTIDDYGRITAVGEGTATITVTCGSQKIELPAEVKYDAAAETQAPTEAAAPAIDNNNTASPVTPTTSATATAGLLKLKKTDITFFRVGTYFTLELEGGIAPEDVDWMTSDSSIATVYNGRVTALGKGICVVTAEYNGQTAQCVVRCKF